MTTTLRRSHERGHADHGWLDAYHTFSFADYFDPAHVQFGPLRVLNQDRIAPGAGFGEHGHADMEIVTVVLTGELEHRDSMGNVGRLRAGDVQVMSAGAGIRHAERNPSPTEPLELLQMWVLPRTNGGEPWYTDRTLDAADLAGGLHVVLSTDPDDGTPTIDQDARLLLGTFAPGERTTLALAPGRRAWIHVATGRVRVGGDTLGPGDGLGLSATTSVELEGLDAAHVTVWDLA